MIRNISQAESIAAKLREHSPEPILLSSSLQMASWFIASWHRHSPLLTNQRLPTLICGPGKEIAGPHGSGSWTIGVRQLGGGFRRIKEINLKGPRANGFCSLYNWGWGRNLLRWTSLVITGSCLAIIITVDALFLYLCSLRCRLISDSDSFPQLTTLHTYVYIHDNVSILPTAINSLLNTHFNFNISYQTTS